ncbi:hypothetical protein EC957_011513 [Mortierella hygrophila]|uniref:Bulb-type lectin domain-containing protein n=1 Tax=Mortierella hygrophila TaxID=979708 RepID=A0A9P6K3U5_9FUNG|nr:hypothetical protein EC957_011513 [Mortierella hygrophila]
MKTLHITAAILLAAATTSNAQATSLEPAFGLHFGLSYVYEIVTTAAQEATKMMTKHKNYNKAETNYFVRVGTNGVGSTGTPVKSDGSSGMDGPFPLIEIFDSTGTALTSTEGGKKKPYLDSGEFNRTSSKVVFAGGTHYRMKVTAGDDGAPNPNAACISSIAVSPDVLSGSPTYAISAELIVSVDSSVSWYYSGQQSYAHIPSNDCRPVRIPGVCFWLSQFVKKDYTPVYSIELVNIPEYVALLAAPEANLPAPGSVKITRSARQETPKPEPAPAAGAAMAPTKRDVDVKLEGYNHANIGLASAKDLCESSSSHGPNYLSTEEELYCDMTTHTLFSKCKSISDTGCYRIVNDNAVSVVQKPAKLGEEDPVETAEPVLLTLRLFGSGADAIVTTKDTLKKRVECVKGTSKAALNVGETLVTTDFVASEEGGRYRLVVLGSTGDVIVYYAASGSSEPSSIAVWRLGANGPRDSSYIAEVNANGQICSRTLAGVVLKCTGPVSPLGPTYQLTVSKMGAVYIKNGGTVVWTTDPQVTPTSHEIAGTVLTETNSFKSLDSITESRLTSTNGKTTLEFKDAKLCLYNSFKFQTWCLPPPAGDNPQVRYILTTRGSICILRTTNGPLSSSCSGNVGVETSYIAVVHDDGFLKIYNSAEELVWQRGGVQTLSETNTLQAGGFKPMLEEIKSANGQFSLLATETGGLVLRNTSDATTVWQLGGGLMKGEYTIELGKDGNLCVGTALVHSRVSCITGTAKKEDQYVLVVEDDGHVAILASDGSVAWRST